MLATYTLFCLFALWQSVCALPAPQGGGGVASCDGACTSVLSAANSCSTLPATQQTQCLCGTSGFLRNAEACVSCGGGSIFNADGLYYIGLAVDLCGGSTASGSSLPSSTGSSGSASSIGTASGVNGGAVPVTEDPTQPISIEAWAPSGFSPTLDYNIAATGGVNTTIAAVETVTITTASQTFTATVTVGFVLDPTAIVQYQGNDGFDDYTYCKLVNATTGDCIELEFDGTSLTASSRFTLRGATSTWVALPAPTGSEAVATGVSAAGTSLVTLAPATASASGTDVAAGTLGGIGSLAAPSSASSG